MLTDLPPPAFPTAFGIVLGTLLNDVIILTLVIVSLNMAVSKTFALRVCLLFLCVALMIQFGYPLKANKELYAMGGVNVVRLVLLCLSQSRLVLSFQALYQRLPLGARRSLLRLDDANGV